LEHRGEIGISWEKIFKKEREGKKEARKEPRLRGFQAAGYVKTARSEKK